MNVIQCFPIKGADCSEFNLSETESLSTIFSRNSVNFNNIEDVKYFIT